MNCRDAGLRYDLLVAALDKDVPACYLVDAVRIALGMSTMYVPLPDSPERDRRYADELPEWVSPLEDWSPQEGGTRTTQAAAPRVPRGQGVP